MNVGRDSANTGVTGVIGGRQPVLGHRAVPVEVSSAQELWGSQGCHQDTVWIAGKTQKWGGSRQAWGIAEVLLLPAAEAPPGPHRGAHRRGRVCEEKMVSGWGAQGRVPTRRWFQTRVKGSPTVPGVSRLARASSPEPHSGITHERVYPGRDTCPRASPAWGVASDFWGTQLPCEAPWPSRPSPAIPASA